jgi:hypothetical protein
MADVSMTRRALFLAALTPLLPKRKDIRIEDFYPMPLSASDKVWYSGLYRFPKPIGGMYQTREMTPDEVKFWHGAKFGVYHEDGRIDICG